MAKKLPQIFHYRGAGYVRPLGRGVWLGDADFEHGEYLTDVIGDALDAWASGRWCEMDITVKARVLDNPPDTESCAD